MPSAAILAALFAVAAPAGENQPAPEPVSHDAVYLEVGLGGPLGVLGVEWVSRVRPWLEVSWGVGFGWAAAASGSNGDVGQVLQWSVMPRLLLGNERGGATLGAGVSGGGYGDWGAKYLCFDDPCPSTYPLTYALWANAEVGGEAWLEHGLAVRFFGGWAHGWCTSSTICRWAPTDVPYLGAGVGYAF